MTMLRMIINIEVGPTCKKCMNNEKSWHGRLNFWIAWIALQVDHYLLSDFCFQLMVCTAVIKKPLYRTPPLVAFFA